MAKLTLSSSEPVKVIRLIEQMFPGVQLEAMEKMISDITIVGDVTLTKKIAADSTVTLEVIITPDK